jgi:hypothetical protein
VDVVSLIPYAPEKPTASGKRAIASRMTALGIGAAP